MWHMALQQGYLDGQILIAMPAAANSEFADKIIYLCAHSSAGAMGIVVNRPALDVSFRDLLVRLAIIGAGERIALRPRANIINVVRGGPVESKRGFVLHSDDYFLEDSTLPIGDGICLTATLDILKAIARGTGPANAMLALGYVEWGPGDLEDQFRGNKWLHCAADDELLFGIDLDRKYGSALQKIGVDLGKLSSEAGHA
jgi:putative transcriptional regulator